MDLDDAAAQLCRAAVSRRQGGDPRVALDPAPAVLEPVSSALSEVDPRFRRGELEVVVVDLAHVIATQPVVAVDELRTGALPSDPTLVDVASVTLPVAPTHLPTTAFDERAQAWIVRSRGASIAVSGRYVAAPESGDPGSQCFGFLVSAQPSRVTVGIYEDRLVLIDGHHRAVALVALGLRRVPVALDYSPTLLLSLEHLRREVILGTSPPMLRDYLDTEVSLDTVIAPTERIILISATEVELPA
jgi:hypothetical protein